MIFIISGIFMVILLCLVILIRIRQIVLRKILGLGMVIVSPLLFVNGVLRLPEGMGINIVISGGILLCIGVYLLAKRRITVKNIVGILLTILSVAIFITAYKGYEKGTASWSWGINGGDGRLGIGTTVSNSYIPVKVLTKEKFTDIAAGRSHVLALHAGSIWSWGNNFYGKLGYKDIYYQRAPRKIEELVNVRAIAAGEEYSLALDREGYVYGWGKNTDGQLGDGTYTNHANPVRVSNLCDVVKIACGSNHSLAIDGNNDLWAWGYNLYGQLGVSGVFKSNVPLRVTGVSKIIDIACGSNHSIALDMDGRVWAFGSNWYGQLGDGTNHGSYTPVLSQIRNVIKISSGGYHNFARNMYGEIFGWGQNQSGQLGDGSYTNKLVPELITNLGSFKMISAGEYTSIGVDKKGLLYTWGENSWGSLGNGRPNQVNSYEPVRVKGIRNVTATAGSRYNGYAVQTYPLNFVYTAMLIAAFILLLGMLLSI